ncbi:tail fiber assembly protein [Rahnella ecdela]|uniref:Tail fiber assembly protein n=1 Tax=Rahnella ecdela TaxID=2816250 RepID=A0ABS6LJZ5_9GAMM|nr:tail fiber assembly protein [Rahnella ecdela]MBU9847163.1 tail fiber assembly protein [Rahnella ecdela]
MITFKNIKISKQVFEEGLAVPVLYFEDENGNDWYTLRDEKWAGKNAFIAVGQDGFINTWSENPNFLTLSEGVSVYEVSAKNLPADIGQQTYGYQDGTFIKFEPVASEVAEKKRNDLLSKAAIAIAPLQDAVDIDDATEAELQELKAWKTCRVALNRLDLTSATDITWPELPGKKIENTDTVN